MTHKFLAVKIALMNTSHDNPRRHKANSSRLDFLQFSFGFLHAGPAIYSFIVWARVNSRVHFKRQRNPQPISKEIRKVAETIYLINLPALASSEIPLKIINRKGEEENVRWKQKLKPKAYEMFAGEPP